MTSYEIAQLEFAVALFCASAIPLALGAWWVVRRRHWPIQPTASCALILSVCSAAWALCDGENGKSVPPQVIRWMRFRSEWAHWTHAVRAEWSEAIAAIQRGFESVDGMYNAVVALTNEIPVAPSAPKVMKVRPNLLINPANNNFKSRPVSLRDNGDGTWTVEVRHSREITDAPTLMMYLRRKRDGASWWVEHESCSFPTNSSPYSYTYTFRMPTGVEGYLAVADEILLGGPKGLQIEGVVVVDPSSGHMYEGITGTYIFDDRPIWIKGGQFLLEPATAATEEPQLMSRAIHAPNRKPPKFAMPPFDPPQDAL